MSLTEKQRQELHRMLADELRAAWSAALADGMPRAALAAMVDARRAAVRAGAGDDVPDLGDHPVNDLRVGEAG
jgi:hypothetical protein